MPGEPIVKVGDALSTSECRHVKPGTLFTFMKSVGHHLAEDIGDTAVVNKLPLRDNHTDWETVLQGPNNLRLCQADGQTDWKRGGLFRLVVKDKAAILPVTLDLGLGWDTIHQVVSVLSVIARQPIQYRFNPNAPTPWLDPETVEFNHAYTTWEIVRSSGSYVVAGGRGDSSTFSFRVSSTGLGGVLASGSVSGGFITGFPNTETLIDNDVEFTLTMLTGSLRPIDTFADVTTTVGYNLRLSAP